MDKSSPIIKSNSKKVLIWDFDGTIVNLNIDWQRVKKDLLALCNLNHGNLHLEKAFLNEVLYFLINQGKKEQALEIIKKYESSCRYTIIQRSVDFIKKYHKKYQMAIFSDNTRDVIINILTEYRILDYFKIIISKEDVDKYKPDTEGFTKIYNFFKINDKTKLLSLGNSKKDESTAKNFDIEFLKI